MSEWEVEATSPDGSEGLRERVEAKTESAARRKARGMLTSDQKGWTVDVRPVRRMP